MTCHARTVEGSSKAMVSLRWVYEEGLLSRYLPP